jgi:hypothetical protein
MSSEILISICLDGRKISAKRLARAFFKDEVQDCTYEEFIEEFLKRVEECKNNINSKENYNEQRAL